ncbi:MAG: GW dipeptide domain-containing protein [Chitinophagales bacterium]
MKYNSLRLILMVTVIVGTAIGCQNQPKVIAPANNATEMSGQQSTGIFSEEENEANTETLTTSADNTTPSSSIGNDMHTVFVEEVLPTSKYVYLNVREGEEKFWIATLKQEVQVGETYFYRGGLLKTNFESKEYNRIFDKVYLVSKIVPANHGGGQSNMEKGTIETHSVEESLPNENPSTKNAAIENSNRNITKEGSTKIAEIVANPAKYDGKMVQISGECVKVNPNIMGRNWIHLKDGSKDEYDFVVTSILQVQEGQVVTMKGTLNLNRDFGAGYRYDLIVEDGTVVE